MTEIAQKKQYFIASEHFQLVNALISSNSLEKAQISLIRDASSSRDIPPGSTIYVLGEIGQEIAFALHWAKHTRDCSIRHVDCVDRIAL